MAGIEPRSTHGTSGFFSAVFILASYYSINRQYLLHLLSTFTRSNRYHFGEIGVREKMETTKSYDQFSIAQRHIRNNRLLNYVRSDKMPQEKGFAGFSNRKPLRAIWIEKNKYTLRCSHGRVGVFEKLALHDDYFNWWVRAALAMKRYLVKANARCDVMSPIFVFNVFLKKSFQSVIGFLFILDQRWCRVSCSLNLRRMSYSLSGRNEYSTRCSFFNARIRTVVSFVRTRSSFDIHNSRQMFAPCLNFCFCLVILYLVYYTDRVFLV